jgi:hypothetical protein
MPRLECPKKFKEKLEYLCQKKTMQKWIGHLAMMSNIVSNLIVFKVFGSEHEYIVVVDGGFVRDKNSVTYTIHI